MTDRLTFTQKEREYHRVGYAKYVEPGLLQKWDERLAAYEDTGLTPDEITELNDFAASQCAKLLEKNTRLEAEVAGLRAGLEHKKEMNNADCWCCSRIKNVRIYYRGQEMESPRYCPECGEFLFSEEAESALAECERGTEK